MEKSFQQAQSKYQLKIIKNTFINSKSNVAYENFEFELGYISTNINFQGQKLASKLCKELCALYSKHKIFSYNKN